ncbi:MAG: hypothetical protein JXR96_04505, partial [Deltaproteobacteria bacterium]|nr:hypothetical protein [Deltaproteobacteria bacterium]
MRRVLCVALWIGMTMLWACAGSSGGLDAGQDDGGPQDAGGDPGGGDPGGGDPGCAGEHCCTLPTDCPAQYSSPPVCRYPDGTTDCQGTRVDATCVLGVCGSSEV